MNALFRFWNELRRRNVLKGIISYAVFSWVLLQVISVLNSIIAMPTWAGKSTLISLIIFFPFWLVFIWFYDITSSGIKKTATRPDEIDEEFTVAIGKRLNAFILIFLILAIVLLFVDRSRLVSEHEEFNTLAHAEIENSIAVLPFTDISIEKSQAYFADGLAEELINALSKITSIKVTSRTSAFSFIGKNIDIPTIAKQLDVNYILEGSVRAHDSIIRVSVKLIDTKNDTYAWTETWDKQLKNIFQIQNEISKTVAEKLELSISGTNIPQVKEVDPEAYRLYLEARFASNNFDGITGLQKTVSLLKSSIQIDSTYAPSWEFLAHTYHGLNNHNAIPRDEGYLLAKNAALRALKIDSLHASTYDILGTIALDYERDYDKAQRYVDKGLSIEPHNPNVLSRASEVALVFGNPERALTYNKKLVELNPLDEYAHYALASTYYFTKNFKEAEKAFRKSLVINPNTQITYHMLSNTLLFQNKFDEAMAAAKEEKFEAFRWHSLAMVNHAMGNTKEATRYVNQLIEKYEAGFSFQIACTYSMFKNKDKAFYWLDKAIEYEDFGLIEAEMEPTLTFLNSDPRWPKFLEKLGFLTVKL